MNKDKKREVEKLRKSKLIEEIYLYTITFSVASEVFKEPQGI